LPKKKTHFLEKLGKSKKLQEFEKKTEMLQEFPSFSITTFSKIYNL